MSNIPDLSNCKAVSYAQLSSGQTGSGLGLRAGSLLNLKSSFGEAIPLLMYTLGQCCAQSLYSSSSSASKQMHEDAFCTRVGWYLELFVIPCTLTKALVSTKETRPLTMMLPPPPVTLGMVFFWWCTMLFCTKPSFRNYDLVLGDWMFLCNDFYPKCLTNKGWH